MDKSKFSLSWEDYKHSICKGVCSLQQSGEFVDLTLAADGHLVKVHQMIIALASPYFKELLASSPCKHPVIFLNNISHDVLCSLLEYIYTGQVVVQADKLTKFFDTAKALHIKGLYDMNINDLNEVPSSIAPAEVESPPPIFMDDEDVVAKVPSDCEKIVRVPKAAKRVKLCRESTPVKRLFSDTISCDAGAVDDDNDNFNDNCSNKSLETAESSAAISNKGTVQYTVSTRGSLQVILNRYVYNLHSTSQRLNHRRWRCVDYRDKKCTAVVTTKGNVVYSRANLHNHSYHDKKILQKLEMNAVYTAIQDVQGVKGTKDKNDDK